MGPVAAGKSNNARTDGPGAVEDIVKQLGDPFDARRRACVRVSLWEGGGRECADLSLLEIALRVLRDWKAARTGLRNPLERR